MKNIGGKIVIGIVVIIMLIPLISNMFIVFTKYEDLNDIISSTQNYGFALIYVGNDDKTLRKDITDVASGYTDKDNIYFMNNEEMETSDLTSLLGSGKTSGYVFILNGEIIKTIPNTLSKTDLDAYVSEYSVAYDGEDEAKTIKPIREDLIHYKVLDDAESYQKLVKKKKTVTMAIFGHDQCGYCNMYKPVYNTVAEEYGLDIYFFNMITYDKDEYSKIMDLGLKVPESCTQSGSEVDLKDGFENNELGTPLTLFTKNGEVIDCIGGYVNKKTLITKLKTVGLITEEE